MTLHEAMEKIITEADVPLTANQIAALINSRGSYVKKDGKPISFNQVLLRAKTYKQTFDVFDNLISLKRNVELSNVITAFKSLRNVLNHLPNRNRDYLSIFVLFIKRLIDLGEYQGYYHPITGGGPKGNNSSLLKRFIQIVHEVTNDIPQVEVISSDVIHVMETGMHSFQSEEILFHLNTIKTAKLQDKEFTSLFNTLINETEKEMGGIPLATTPEDIRKLLANIFTPANDDFIFDPFVGVAGHFVKLQERCVYDLNLIGQEVNEMAVALAVMNLKISGAKSAHIVGGNSFSIDPEKKFDYVISHPPILGSKPVEYVTQTDDFSALFTSNHSIRGNIAPVVRILNSLSAKGKAAIVVPEAILFASGVEEKLRNLLLEKDWIETIISLPRDFTAASTKTKLNLLILNKNKGHELVQRIHFIDYGNPKNLGSAIDEIIEIYENRSESDRSYLVDRREIVQEDFSLLPSRYLPALKKHVHELLTGDKKLMHLQELAVKLQLQPAVIGKEFLYLNHLTPSPNFELNINSLKSIEVEKAGYYILDRDAILIDKSAMTVRASIFKFTGEPILIGSTILAIEIVNKAITEQFFCYQVNQSILTILQGCKYAQGSIWSFVREKDLMNFLFEVPTLDEQKQQLLDFFSKSVKDESTKGAKFEFAAKRDRDSGSDIIPTLKHTLSHPLATISLGIGTLKKFLVDKAHSSGVIDLSESLDSSLPDNDPDKESFSLINQLAILEGNIKLAQNYLRSAEKLVNLDSYEVQKESIQIRDFLLDTINQEFPYRNFTFSIEGKGFELKTDKQLLRSVVQNIVRNAEIHGFSKNSDKASNRIKIILQKQNLGIMELPSGNLAKLLTITFENNGLPIDPLLAQTARERDAEPFAKGGFGLIFIRKIMKKLDGNINITRIPDDSLDDFKTKFTLIF